MKSVKEELENEGEGSVADAMYDKLRIKFNYLKYGRTEVYNVLLFDRDLSMPARTLAAIILSHCFDVGVYTDKRSRGAAFPSNERLTMITGLGRSQLAKYKQELYKYPSKDRPFLKRIPTGRYNVYDVDIDVLIENKQLFSKVAGRLQSVERKKPSESKD
jgi:hypothetical protein